MSGPALDPSRAAYAIAALVPRVGLADARRAVAEVIGQFTPSELSALASRWSFWARPKQRPPLGRWRSFGLLTSRAFGKTFALSQHVNEEVYAGRARLVGLSAQNEEKTIAIQVTGPSGLIATSHPDFRPEWHSGTNELVWPSGAKAYVLTPEVPGAIRGIDYHLSWLSEIQSWPTATRDEAFSNFALTTRLGYSRTIWDATPKKRHPILRDLLSRSASDPAKHVVIRGTIHENAANLGDGVIEDLERQYGGTSKGREELLGEMLEDSETALVKQEWIERTRRPMPDRFSRRVVSIDPAVTNRRGSDTTGIVDFGLGVDGQGYVLGDDSGKHEVGRWADIVLDRYVQHGCDLVIAETNKGGQLVTQNLRAAAKERNLSVVVVGKDEQPQRVRGTVFVKEVYARGAKEDRAEPVGTAYQRGRISHVQGVDLASLEETLTGWEPSPSADSPGDLDALTHAAIELLGLNENRPDASIGFRGIEQLGKALVQPPKTSSKSFSVLFSGSGGSNRI